MLHQKHWTALALVLCLMLVVMGCAKKEKTPYKVGAIFAITGPASWLGEPERNTVKMIVEEINQADGINGHPLELIIEDTAGDPTNAVNAVNKLIEQDSVLAIIGPSRSGTSLAVNTIAEEKQVPLISCAAAAKIVEGRKWVFKTPQRDDHAVIRILEHAQESGISKIAIITGTTGFGVQGRMQLKELAAGMGIEIMADETYGPADTDMTAQLTKIKESGAGAVVNWSIVPAQAIVPKNMKQLQMDIPLYQSHGFGNIKYVEAAGEAAEGVLFPAGRLLVADTLPDGHPQKALLVKYKNDYEARFSPDKVSTFGGHAYDALHLVVEALNNVGPDRAKVRDAIEARQGFVGTGGIYNFSPDDHTGLTKDAFEMLTVKDGQFARVVDAQP